MIGPDAGVEHGPAYVFAVCAVTEIGRSGLDGVCRCADQRAFAGVAPNADDLQLIEVRSQRFDLQSGQLRGNEMPEIVELGVRGVISCRLDDAD